MNAIQQSETIRAGLRKGFQDGTSKMAQRRCYSYDTGPDGKLIDNPDEADIVSWIFNQYLSGSGLGTITTGLEGKNILSPTEKSKQKREVLNTLSPNFVSIFSKTDC